MPESTLESMLPVILHWKTSGLPFKAITMKNLAHKNGAEKMRNIGYT